MNIVSQLRRKITDKLFFCLCFLFSNIFQNHNLLTLAYSIVLYIFNHFQKSCYSYLVSFCNSIIVYESNYFCHLPAKQLNTRYNTYWSENDALVVTDRSTRLGCYRVTGISWVKKNINKTKLCMLLMSQLNGKGALFILASSFPGGKQSAANWVICVCYCCWQYKPEDMWTDPKNRATVSENYDSHIFFFFKMDFFF